MFVIARPCSMIINDGGTFLVGIRGNEGASRLDNINIEVQAGGLVSWTAGPFVLDLSTMTIHV